MDLTKNTILSKGKGSDEPYQHCLQITKNIHVQSKIDDFFDRFWIGTLLHRCGVRKRYDHDVRSLTQAIFTPPFVEKNFFRGIVTNQDLPFGKNATYQLFKETTCNWRWFFLCPGQRLHSFFNKNRETILIIIDGNPYDHSRPKLVELFSRIRNTIPASIWKASGYSLYVCSTVLGVLPLNFSLLSSVDAKKRLHDSQKILANTRMELKDGRVVKLIVVRVKRKKDWLALLSPYTTLSILILFATGNTGISKCSSKWPNSIWNRLKKSSVASRQAS